MGFISQLIHQNPELSGVVKAGEKYIPFVLIAAAKGFFDHATGIPSVPNTKPYVFQVISFCISQFTNELWSFYLQEYLCLLR